MPLTLPSGLIAVPALGASLDDVLAAARVTSYRFDLLDSSENLLGQLTTVQPGGSVVFDAYASIKGGGSITVTDPGTEIDWLNVRVRPTVIVDRAGFFGEDPSGFETPLGVFIPAAPVEAWSAEARSWKVELLDKLSILDQDVVTNANGDAVTYTAVAGANVVDLVKTLILDAGELVTAIEPGVKTLPSTLVWEAGTTRLRIINDLLDAANYFSLWCDGQGQYRVEPYVEPQDRPITYETLITFSDNENSLMAPEWDRDRDIYSIPNRYIVISQGDGSTEALTSTATNEDPESPYSFPSRGRWITAVDTGVEALSQADLDAIARRRLSSATSVTSSMDVSHVYLPEILVNSMIRFVNNDAGIDRRASVIKTEIPFDPTGLCKSQLREMGNFG